MKNKLYEQLMTAYDKINALYELINNVKPIDIDSPYYKKAKELIEIYNNQVKVLKEEYEKA